MNHQRTSDRNRTYLRRLDNLQHNWTYLLDASSRSDYEGWLYRQCKRGPRMSGRIITWKEIRYNLCRGIPVVLLVLQDEGCICGEFVYQGHSPLLRHWWDLACVVSSDGVPSNQSQMGDSKGVCLHPRTHPIVVFTDTFWEIVWHYWPGMGLHSTIWNWSNLLHM